jgi:hypothetical protein
MASSLLSLVSEPFATKPLPDEMYLRGNEIGPVGGRRVRASWRGQAVLIFRNLALQLRHVPLNLSTQRLALVPVY